MLTVILCRELALPGKAKSIRPFTRCSAGTGQGHSHRPGRRPRSPEGRAAAALGVPGVTYLPGAPWHQNTQPPSAHQGQRPLEESTAPPTPAGFWNTGPLAWQEAPTDPTFARALQPQQSAPPWGGPLALGSPGKAAWLRWALAGAEVGAGGGMPVTSLPAGAPRAPIGGAVSRGPGVGGAPAASGQARDELRGQPPRDAPQVQLLPQQGLELPAAALGTTKGRVGTARGRQGRGEKAGGPPALRSGCAAVREPGGRRDPQPRGVRGRPGPQLAREDPLDQSPGCAASREASALSLHPVWMREGVMSPQPASQRVPAGGVDLCGADKLRNLIHTSCSLLQTLKTLKTPEP